MIRKFSWLLVHCRTPRWNLQTSHFLYLRKYIFFAWIQLLTEWSLKCLSPLLADTGLSLALQTFRTIVINCRWCIAFTCAIHSLWERMVHDYPAWSLLSHDSGMRSQHALVSQDKWYIFTTVSTSEFLALCHLFYRLPQWKGNITLCSFNRRNSCGVIASEFTME